MPGLPAERRNDLLSDAAQERSGSGAPTRLVPGESGTRRRPRVLVGPGTRSSRPRDRRDECQRPSESDVAGVHAGEFFAEAEGSGGGDFADAAEEGLTAPSPFGLSLSKPCWHAPALRQAQGERWLVPTAGTCEPVTGANGWFPER